MRNLNEIKAITDTFDMVNIFPTRSNQNCLLVSSDRTDRSEARREIAQWAAERALALPRRPRSLALLEDDTVVAEWVVIEQQTSPEPSPPGHHLRNRGHLTLVPGGRAA